MENFESFFNKTYKLVKIDNNFDQYLSSLGDINLTLDFACFHKFSNISGFNRFQIRIAKSLRTTVQLTAKTDGSYDLITNVTVFSRTQKFKPGIEVHQKTVDGRKVINVFTVEEDKLIERQIGDKNSLVTIVREFRGSELISTTYCGKVVTISVCRLVD